MINANAKMQNAFVLSCCASLLSVIYNRFGYRFDVQTMLDYRGNEGNCCKCCGARDQLVAGD